MPAHLPNRVIPILRRPAGRRVEMAPRKRSSDVLTFWRTKEPSRITPADSVRLSDRLAKTEILHERRWHAARHGDPAAAVAVAVDHLHRRVAMTPLTDVVIANLVPLAMAGDPAAALMIAHALRTLGRLDPSNPLPPRLARLWDRRPARGDGSRTYRPSP